MGMIRNLEPRVYRDLLGFWEFRCDEHLVAVTATSQTDAHEAAAGHNAMHHKGNA